MENKIRVIYDIAILGDSTVNPMYRTGIFRVIENILFEILKRDELEILLYPGRMNYRECLKYLSTSTILNHCELYLPKFYGVDMFFSRVIGRTCDIINGNKSSAGKLFWKVTVKALRILYWVYKRVSSLWENRRKKAIFRDYNIFHASFYRVPNLAREIKSIKRFTTVFDIIPILYPYYFVNGNKHPLRKVISRLDSHDYIFCISKATKDDLCAYTTKINPDNAFVTYLAASDAFHVEKDENKLYAMKKKYGIPLNCRYILSLSTLEPRKNINLTIKSFIQVISCNDVDDLYLVLAGAKGWKYDTILSDLDKSSRYRNRIILTGYVEDGDLAPLFSGAMVFVYPSFYEGFGLPPLEAMQCGTPVITSNTSSFPEVVGDAGIMIDPNDLDGLSNNILRLYHDFSLRYELSKKSLKRAREFSWEKCADSMIAAYRKAINN